MGNCVVFSHSKNILVEVISREDMMTRVVTAELRGVDMAGDCVVELCQHQADEDPGLVLDGGAPWKGEALG